MPFQLPPSPVITALVIALVLVVVLWRRQVGRAGRETRRRQRRARRAEVGAERLLERAGYEILDRQLEGAWPIEVDGRERWVSMRADLLVRRRRRRYVAEVKSGAQATRPDNPQTRRQLLEYRLAYDVDGVLLVDMEAEQVIEVVFPAERTGRASRSS